MWGWFGGAPCDVIDVEAKFGCLYVFNVCRFLKAMYNKVHTEVTFPPLWREKMEKKKQLSKIKWLFPLSKEKNKEKRTKLVRNETVFWEGYFLFKRFSQSIAMYFDLFGLKNKFVEKPLYLSLFSNKFYGKSLFSNLFWRIFLQPVMITRTTCVFLII